MTRLALAVDASHPAFAGHFPSRAVVPGVVLLDESLRAIAANFGEDAIADTVCRIGFAKFLSPVGPGEALRLEVEAASRPADASGAPSVGYAFSVFAGAAASERLAVTGTIMFEPRVARAPV